MIPFKQYTFTKRTEPYFLPKEPHTHATNFATQRNAAQSNKNCPPQSVVQTYLGVNAERNAAPNLWGQIESRMCATQCEPYILPKEPHTHATNFATYSQALTLIFGLSHLFDPSHSMSASVCIFCCRIN